MKTAEDTLEWGCGHVGPAACRQCFEARCEELKTAKIDTLREAAKLCHAQQNVGVQMAIEKMIRELEQPAVETTQAEFTDAG